MLRQLTANFAKQCRRMPVQAQFGDVVCVYAALVGDSAHSLRAIR
jgi:hypothetical protein